MIDDGVFANVYSGASSHVERQQGRKVWLMLGLALLALLVSAVLVYVHRCELSGGIFTGIGCKCSAGSAFAWGKLACECNADSVALSTCMPRPNPKSSPATDPPKKPAMTFSPGYIQTSDANPTKTQVKSCMVPPKTMEGKFPALSDANSLLVYNCTHVFVDRDGNTSQQLWDDDNGLKLDGVLNRNHPLVKDSHEKIWPQAPSDNEGTSR